MTHPPLLLLPGLLCDAEVWAHVRTPLTAAHCQVPVFSDAPSLEAMARRVLDQAPAGRFALAGHSMGGRVALEVLRLAPDRVDRLALLDSGMEPLAPGADGEAERNKRLALLQLARNQGMRAMGRIWAQGMVHPMQLGTPLFERLLDMIERHPPERFASQIQALLTRPDARPVLAALRCPTLLLCGRQDTWSPLERHAHMQALVPHATLSVIEDCGHMSPMEQAGAVAAALNTWLQA